MFCSKFCNYSQPQPTNKRMNLQPSALPMSQNLSVYLVPVNENKLSNIYKGRQVFGPQLLKIYFTKKQGTVKSYRTQEAGHSACLEVESDRASQRHRKQKNIQAQEQSTNVERQSCQINIQINFQNNESYKKNDYSLLSELEKIKDKVINQYSLQNVKIILEFNNDLILLKFNIFQEVLKSLMTLDPIFPQKQTNINSKEHKVSVQSDQKGDYSSKIKVVKRKNVNKKNQKKSEQQINLPKYRIQISYKDQEQKIKLQKICQKADQDRLNGSSITDHQRRADEKTILQSQIQEKVPLIQQQQQRGFGLTEESMLQQNFEEISWRLL